MSSGSDDERSLERPPRVWNPYTPAEDKWIVNTILRKGWHWRRGGNEIWKEMARMMELDFNMPRTRQSLKQRYCRIILRDLHLNKEELGLSATDFAELTS